MGRRPLGHFMLRPFAVALLVLLALPVAAAQETTALPEPRESPACEGAGEAVLFAKATETGFENLAFDGAGNLFLTGFGSGLWRAWPNGTLAFVAADPREPDPPGFDDPNAFMGVDVGPDGALYVSVGLSVAAPVAGRVLRFPVPGEPAFEAYAVGLPGANGLAVTPDGVVYVVHGFRDEVWRVPAAGAVELWTRVLTGNGLVEHPDGERLVFGQVADGTNRALAVRLDDPAVRETLVTFNAGPSGEDPGAADPSKPVHAKGVDDLVVASDGRVYAAAHLRLQVLRGDPATGEACVLLGEAAGRGPQAGPPTSARIARGFGAWDGWLFATNAAGEIWAVDIGDRPPAAAAPEEDDGAVTPAAGFAFVALAAALAAVVASGRRRGER